MLAGDVGTTTTSVNDVAAICGETQTSQTRTLIVIDARVDDIDTLLPGIDPSAELVVIDSDQNAIDVVGKWIKSARTDVASLHIVCHGSDGELLLGDRTLDHGELRLQNSKLRAWSEKLTSSADILLYGCEVASSKHGMQFIELLAELTGADVAASSNLTGSAKDGSDWILESSTGRIDVALAFDLSTRKSYQHTLNIVINAWGQTGDETFDLVIDNRVVHSYQADTTWTPFVYKTNDAISPDKVRIQFTNDQYDPHTGYDRNLFVNNIQIHGANYETDSANTYSTGSWLPADRLQPGFGRGIVLHSDGYFQYGLNPGERGSRITVLATGQTGDEIMQIRSDDGDLIGEFHVSTDQQEYSADSNQVVGLRDININFVNDAYDPDCNYDRNLIIDSVSTENLSTGARESLDVTASSQSVFSTGTWTSQDGVTEGFGRGNTLHTDGQMSFDRLASNGSSLRLDTSFGNQGETETEATWLVTTDDFGRIASTQSEVIVVHDSNGNLDLNFGGDGSVSLSELISPNLDGFVDLFASRFAITDIEYTDRGLLVGGEYQPVFGFDTPRSVFVALLNPDGTLVDGYVNGVVVNTDIELGAFNGGVRVTLDSQSRTIIAGESVGNTPAGSDGDNMADLAISRLDFSGSIDPTFGDNGTLVVGRPFNNQEIYNALIDVHETLDGGYVFVASAISPNLDNSSAVVKVSESGSLDPSFADSGISLLNVNATDLTIDQQNNLLVSGYRLGSDQGYVSYRLLSEGTLDSRFGDNGVAIAKLNPSLFLAEKSLDFFPFADVVVQDDGGVLFIAAAKNQISSRGGAILVENAGTVVLRLDSGGNVDTTFGGPGDGYLILEVGAGGQTASNAVLDFNGDLILAGLRFQSVDAVTSTPVIAKFEFV